MLSNVSSNVSIDNIIHMHTTALTTAIQIRELDYCHHPQIDFCCLGFLDLSNWILTLTHKIQNAFFNIVANPFYFFCTSRSTNTFQASYRRYITHQEETGKNPNNNSCAGILYFVELVLFSFGTLTRESRALLTWN